MAVGSSSGCFAEWAADVEPSAAGEIDRRAENLDRSLRIVCYNRQEIWSWASLGWCLLEEGGWWGRFFSFIWRIFALLAKKSLGACPPASHPVSGQVLLPLGLQYS